MSLFRSVEGMSSIRQLETNAKRRGFKSVPTAMDCNTKIINNNVYLPSAQSAEKCLLPRASSLQALQALQAALTDSLKPDFRIRSHQRPAMTAAFVGE